MLHEAQAEDQQDAREFAAQEKEDDRDLQELKQKLQDAKDMPKPGDKDKMIEYLMKRLQLAQESVSTCEEIIKHERDNRKEVSQDIKERNAILK